MINEIVEYYLDLVDIESAIVRINVGFIYLVIFLLITIYGSQAAISLPNLRVS